MSEQSKSNDVRYSYSIYGEYCDGDRVHKGGFGDFIHRKVYTGRNVSGVKRCEQSYNEIREGCFKLKQKENTYE